MVEGLRGKGKGSFRVVLGFSLWIVKFRVVGAGVCSAYWVYLLWSVYRAKGIKGIGLVGKCGAITQVAMVIRPPWQMICLGFGDLVG